MEHPGDVALIDWWLHEADAATTEAVDEHLMVCDECGERLDRWVALAEGVREAFRAGLLGVVISAPFLARLRDAGLRVREYAPPAGGSVNCSVAPEDQLLVSHLRAPLQGVQRVDVQVTVSLRPGHAERLQDVPFDAQRGELLYAPKIAEIRRRPAHTVELTLLAVEGAEVAPREIARYRFNHAPWTGG